MRRMRGLIVLLTPRVNEKKDPRSSQYDIANCLPEPIPGEILDPSLEVNPPHGRDNVQHRAPFGEERLELPVLDEGNHEEQEPDCKQQETREGVGGPNQELVVRRGAQKLRGGLDPVADGVDFLHVEHHQSPARGRDRRVEQADHHECRRRRRCHSNAQIVFQKQVCNVGMGLCMYVWESAKP